jgi:hypothetical protein
LTKKFSFADEKRAALELWANHVEHLLGGEPHREDAPKKKLSASK